MAIGLALKGIQLAIKALNVASKADKAGAVTTLGATVVGGAGAITSNKVGRDMRVAAQKKKNESKPKK